MILDIYNTNDFSSKAFKIVLVNLLKVIVINLALDILIALNSYILLKVFFSSSV